MIRDFVDDDEESVEKTQGLHSAHFADFQDHGHPLPVEELIAALLDGVHAVWFATSAKDGELGRRTKELEAEDGIQRVVNSGAVEHGKPASDTFEEAPRRAKASTAETVALSDAIWDVESAKEVGIRTVAVLSGGTFDGETRREAGAAEVQKDCAALPEAGFPGEVRRAGRGAGLRADVQAAPFCTKLRRGSCTGPPHAGPARERWAQTPWPRAR